MTRLSRAYFFVLEALGVVVTSVLVISSIDRRVGVEVGLLVFLGMMAAWLRFNLNPIGYVSLAPVISFVALLSHEPSVSVLVASLSALVGARLFGRKGWDVATGEAGEEALSIMLSVVLFRWTSSHGLLTGFTAAVSGYALCRVLFTALRGKLREDISHPATLFGAGPYIAGNVLLMGVVAFAVARATPIYSRFGLLGLGLTVVALAEFYRPWKLLSQQADDLYASLAIIAEAIDIKDPYTGRHSRRVAEMSTKLARRLSLSEHEVNTIRIGALLHDIGKIGVSGNIIRKPGSLESSEMKAMQRHPVISANIMEPVEYFRDAALLVRHHHEHYDGTGYPDGLQADDIPIGSRIILVADAYDAMTTDRPYRKGKPGHEALRTLKDRAGRQFDGRVVGMLEEIIVEFEGI